MWRHVEVSATIAHPVDLVFPYLVDPLRWHEFAPACVFRRQMDDQPPRIGTRWMATDRIGPFHFHFIDELAVLVPNQRVVWLSSAPWNSRVEYACAPRGDVTDIEASYEGDISGSLRLLTWWLPPGLVRWVLSQDFRRLDDRLEREAMAASRWQRGHRADLATDDGFVAVAVDPADEMRSR
jgi:Polyketide cyclase / dehydrase and lipid transport